MTVNRPARRPSTGLLSIATAWAVLAAIGPAFGDDPKPAKKDNNPAIQPKEAAFSARVTPETARPGEAVTLSVTARLEPGWHVYGFNPKQPDEGPRVTQFDLFDPAGLTPKGAWTPDRAPTRKKEAAFPELPFVEFHEDEVTWSIGLVVPKDAAPGRRAIRVQAAYQLCTNETCSFPGQWTLPAAPLTIVAPGAAPKRLEFSTSAAAARLLAVATVALDDTPKGKSPAEKDNSARLKPKAVTFATSVEPKEARAGEAVSYRVTAKLDPKWHIFKYKKLKPDEDAESYTVFDLFDPAGLTPNGDWTASREPLKNTEAAKVGSPPIDYFEGEVTWSIPLVVPTGTKPGKLVIRNQAGYQVCNAGNCSIPGRWTLPDVELTVVPGAAVVAALPAAVPAIVPAASESSGSPPSIENKSEVEGLAEKGWIPFLLACASGGLLALAMPCVWPMIPITVNFFVKQGQKKKGATTGLAIGYCLAIIGVFMGVGLLFAVFFGAGSLSALANNPWVNFAIAGLFLAFGLSLLGLFEIRLPNFLLNASAKGEGRGGVVGVMFMALTLTITSFTCTFPVVGGLLVIAAKGNYLYPIVGMATFATVLALPFFVLALAPGLLSKVPKSGDWMNAVKVVGGLVEIGAAFKFINTAECSYVVPSEAFFNAYAVLAIWIVLALICGIYLLGLFRTDHDHEAIKVGPGRMVLGGIFLFFSLFLTPALFGRPPQSRLYFFVVGLLPADAADLKAPTGPAGGEAKTLATSSDPQQALREQSSFHGVSWGMSLEGAIETARKEGKPILIDFTGVNCANCRLMEAEVFPRPEVVAKLKEFVTVQLYSDTVPIKSISSADRKRIARENLELESKYASEVTNPLYVALAADRSLLGSIGGKRSPEEFIKFLDDARAKLPGSTKVASGN